MIIKKNNWSIEIEETSSCAKIKGGNFGDMHLMEAPLFCAELEDVVTHEIKTINSADSFKNVSSQSHNDQKEFVFETDDNIKITVKSLIDDKGISWETSVENNSDILTVNYVSYPVLKLKNELINVFLPQYSGRVIKDYAKSESKEIFHYPSHCQAEMQYFAFYNTQGGVYMGIHDKMGCIKRFNLYSEKGITELITDFVGIGASLKGNSFKLSGQARWEYIKNDWFDASLIYKEFVLSKATWLPQKGENGRLDTPERFKDVPLWIVDYIPNSKEQMEARPMILGTVSQLYDANYWYDAPIKLKKELNLPLAYHVYNWHEIPFNINYPHFYPPKDEFKKGLEYLKNEDIYVLPYINGVSWETKDADEGFEINFENTGIKGAALQADGSFAEYEYPQVKKSGKKTMLAPICPGFEKWHSIIGNIVKDMETNLKIDGVYFDEIAAHKAHPCLSSDHNHIPGGGSHWADNYNLMVKKIRSSKPKGNYYFTESNCECYMKEFDGMLTWLWTGGDLVPAFPAIYSGYVQMIGRFTDGLNREDNDYFRFHIAQQLTFGQQLGWIHPDIIYKKERLEFLKTAVNLRYKYTKLFNSGTILRPPHVTSNIKPVESSGIKMEQIQTGLWQTPDKDKKVLFVINVSATEAECKVSFEDKSLDLVLKPYEFYVKEF